MKKEKPIRVAHVIGKMCAGGVEAVVFNYYREINKSEVQFDFYYDADSTVEPPQELIDMGARFIENPPYQRIWEYIPFLIKSFRQNEYRIIHSHMNTLSVFPLFAATMANCPVRIAHNHSVPGNDNWLRNALKYILKIFSKCFATDYFACSEKAARWLFGDAEYENGNVTVIRNAIDYHKFEVPQAVHTDLIKELGLEDKFVVGHIGRFTYAKNHKFLIDVFSKIKALREDAVLVLVGDGEMRKEIETWIRQAGVEEDVVLVGKTMEPAKYYSVMDVVLMPSFFEGLSMATIEAQISGVPTIVSDAIPGETNISNGWMQLSLDRSHDEWAKRAIQFAGQEVVLDDNSKHYNIELEVDNLLQYYKKVI